MLSAKKTRVAAPDPGLSAKKTPVAAPDAGLSAKKTPVAAPPEAPKSLVPASSEEASSQATTIPGMLDTQQVATPARSGTAVPALVPRSHAYIYMFLCN